MEQKKGFTLIELLAVILILGIIALIAVGSIGKIITIAKKNALKITATNIGESADNLYSLSNEAEQFYYADGEEYNGNSKKLAYTGKKPESGFVDITDAGRVAIIVYDGTYCATKAGDTDEVIVEEKAFSECTTYNIINTDDTWQEIANDYDMDINDLLELNEETNKDSLTEDRDIKVPLKLKADSEELVLGDTTTVLYKTYYTVAKTTYSEGFTSATYQYTIELGSLPLHISDIETVRVTSTGVFEELNDFKQYLVKKLMGEVVWPAGEEVTLDVDDAPTLQSHAARKTNMTADNVSVSCNASKCTANVTETVNNLTGVNPNVVNGEKEVYLPVKFTVEFNGEPDFCAISKVTDTTPGILSGLGTQAEPYLVESLEDLVALSSNVKTGNTYSDKYISLLRSLDFNDNNSYINPLTTAYGDINGNSVIEDLKTELTTGAGFISIGDNTNKFMGIFLGNQGCINNLYINRPTTDNVGFVGVLTGSIRNLSLVQANITGQNYVGGIAGVNSGKIIDNNFDGNVTGNNYVGSITGILNWNSNYVAIGVTSLANVSGASYVGGLVGYVDNTSTLKGVLKGGTVVGTGSNVGRTVGGNYYGTRLSYAVSSVTVNGSIITSKDVESNAGASISSIDDVLKDINVSELAFDTYIGGDNDGDGYYWDYNDAKTAVVEKNITHDPLIFDLSGAGTAADPYLISDYYDMRQATLNLGSTYKITTNLDLVNKKFYMLGTISNRFTGTLIGNQKTISNIDINAENASYVGFTGYNSGTIKNLTLNNLNIIGSNYTAGIAGFNDNLIIDVNINGDITGNNYVGLVTGFLPWGDDNKAIGINASGNVIGVSNVGGFTGYMDNYADLRGVFTSGSVVGTGTKIGRVVGDNYYGDKRIYALSTITVNGSAVSSSYIDSNGGTSISNLSDVTGDINAAELVYDTYIGGDNDGDGYYWDYNDAKTAVVEKSIIDYPLTFTLSGAGTAADPYLISNYSDMRQATLNLSSTYKITTNLDLNAQKFYMLGSYINSFTGTLIGNQKTISNIEINADKASYVGFVGYNSGTIKNLTLNNLDINGSNYTAGIVGFNDNLIIDVNINGDVTGNNYVGLVTGYLPWGDDNKAIGINASGNVLGVSNVGGFVGYLDNYADLRGVFTSGSVVGTGTKIGRVVGDNYYGDKRVYALSTITVNGSTVASSSIDSNGGTSISNLSDVTGDINTSELVYDTYIGGDNDGDGYYWDYNDAKTAVVEKSTIDYPLTFTLSGAGTVADPYLVSTYDELRQATTRLNSTFKLVTNLNLSGQKFYMFGSYINNFMGTFDGNGNSLSNISINSPKASYIGFAGYLGSASKVIGLNINNININAYNYVGGYAGYSGDGNVKDATITGNINSSGNYAGGVVGYSRNGTVASVLASADVTGVDYIGGLTGYSYDCDMTKGIAYGGSISSTGANSGRLMGGAWYGRESGSAISSITVNGLTTTSLYTGSNYSYNGNDLVSSDLTNTLTYTNLGFNFTDENLDYIWYIDLGIAKFRAGNL